MKRSILQATFFGLGLFALFGLAALVLAQPVSQLLLERSADNPDGLLVGEYWAKQIEGEKREAVLAGTPGTEVDMQGGAQ